MEFSRKEVLRDSTMWWKCSFELVKDSGIWVIRPQIDSEIEFYYPLKEGERPGKQLSYPKDEGQKWAPHVHLARVENEKDALEFVNKWGLLGLWNVAENNFKYAPMLAPGIDRGFNNEEDYSLWYEWSFPPGIRPVYPQYFCHQEPVDMFMEASYKYKRLINNLKTEQEEGINSIYGLWGCLPRFGYSSKEKRWVMDWQFNSLYDALRLRVALDLSGGAYGFRHCKWERCGRPFLAEHDTDKFCSYRCQNNYFSAESKRRKKEGKK